MGCGIHIQRNPIRYHLVGIKEISGLDLEDSETWFILHLPVWAGEIIRGDQAIGLGSPFMAPLVMGRHEG